MRIQIVQIFKESLIHVWKYRREWVRVSFAPFVIWGVGVIFMGFSYWVLPILEDLTYYFFSFVADLAFFINGYRYALLNEGRKEWWTLHFNQRFAKMVLYYLFFLLIIGIVCFIGTYIGMDVFFGRTTTLSIILALPFVSYGLYLLCRLSLASLFIALDQKKPLRMSWKLLKGNVVRFIGLILIIGLPLFLIKCALVVLTRFNPAASIIISLFVWLIFWAVVSKASALVFESLKERLENPIAP